ncbi:MAG: hypothetical protein BWY85_00134 [Firmicutes bacterium ADurb.Bin506]|nr:MAG: hypothetical protein BWY85_00134 [Firmicutes bacterium ADurb.Bin506]
MALIYPIGHFGKTLKYRMLTILCPVLITVRWPDKRFPAKGRLDVAPYGVGAALSESGEVRLVRVPLPLVKLVEKMRGRAFSVRMQKPGPTKRSLAFRSAYVLEVLDGPFPKRTAAKMEKAEDLLDNLALDTPLFASFEAAERYFCMLHSLPTPESLATKVMARK